MYLVTHMAEICMYLQARKYFELSYNFKPLISYFFKLFSPICNRINQMVSFYFHYPKKI